MAAAKSNHVPLRTCVICGKKSPQRKLVRIAARPDGSVGIDETKRGQGKGRGAYACADRACYHLEIKRGRVEHALRTKMNNEDWVNLQKTIECRLVGQSSQT